MSRDTCIFVHTGDLRQFPVACHPFVNGKISLVSRLRIEYERQFFTAHPKVWKAGRKNRIIIQVGIKGDV